MGKVKAICISKIKGVQKEPILKGHFIEDFGLENDSHAGKWHRQISLLAKEDIDEFKKQNIEVSFGAFGENIVTEGLSLQKLKVGDLLKCNDVILQVSQIGKACHNDCIISKKTGKCIMPKLGIFAKVIKGGYIQIDDEINIIERNSKFAYQAAVITMSDSSFNHVREDLSGPLVTNYLKEKGYDIVEQIILPDEKEPLKQQLIDLCDHRYVDLIITTGGTGFSMRDVTPEATSEIAEKNAPGIAEAIRYNSLKYTSHAMLSRGVSVIRKQTLIINLPGSPKAVKESLDIIIETLAHAHEILRGQVSSCARK